MFDRLRVRLAFAYVGIFALILVLFSAVTLAVFWRQTVSRQDAELKQLARKVVGEAPGGNGAATDTADNYGYVVLDAEGRVQEGDDTAADLGLPVARAAAGAWQTGEAVFATVDGPEGTIRVVSVPTIQSGTVVSVTQVATFERSTLDPVYRLLFVLVPIGVGALALAGGGGLVMSRRAVRPVREAFERQRAFVAEASHELKTPLALIRIDADVLLRDPAAPDGREILEHQVAEIDRMNALLSDLLVLARLDAGKIDLTRARFDLATVIARTADRFRPRATAGEVGLQLRLPDRLIAYGDADRTGQVLSALLDNALRFTPDGGCITITGCRRDGRAEVVVADTGPGIDPAHMPRVFDRFYRSDAHRADLSRQAGGAGLGLAIARDMARAQGGELVLGNATVGGAEATLRLPLDGQARADPAAPVPARGLAPRRWAVSPWAASTERCHNTAKTRRRLGRSGVHIGGGAWHQRHGTRSASISAGRRCWRRSSR